MVIIENKKDIKFTVDVKEHDQYIKIDVNFKEPDAYVAKMMVTYPEDSLTIGVFPFEFNNWEESEQNDWYKNVPVIHITYSTKFSGCVYKSGNTNSFVVLSKNV